MNDTKVFTTFLNDIAGLDVARSRNEVTDFVHTFEALLSTTKAEINDFVKNAHVSYTSRAVTQKILIPIAAIITIKALHFELSDREKCGTLPDLAA